RRLARREAQRRDRALRVAHRERRELGDGVTAEADGARARVQPPARAGGAGPLDGELLERGAVLGRERLAQDPDPARSPGRALARRAGALAAVEREEARVERLEAEAAGGAEEPLGVEPLAALGQRDQRPAPEAQRALDGVVQAREIRRQGGDHQVDVVLAVAV